MALGAKRCVAYNLEVFVAHPKGCEDRSPVELEGEVWILLRRSSPQLWILLLELASDQDTTTYFVLPCPTRTYKLHERVYKACILAACRMTLVHDSWCPSLLIAEVVRAGIGRRRGRDIWVRST